MNFTASFLNRAGSANITLHLHLAVGQLAAILLATEDIIASPVDSADALGRLSLDDTLCITLVRRQSGVRTADLEV